jgi:alpha-L-fucosidase
MLTIERSRLLKFGASGPMLKMMLSVAIPLLVSQLSAEPAAGPVLPTAEQAAWQDLELAAFAHFGINTFTDREWGEGNEDPKLFNPSALDARQWVRALKAAGAGLLIITAKHHDGFCLWPTKLTEHCVRSSPWKDGKGDVVGEVAVACREEGIRFGFYLSPWDRHEKRYGTPEYNEFFKGQLRELLTGYGDVAEVWFDGACGEGPNGKKQEYDFPGFYKVVRECQPKALIAICGPDVRWVGNESGVAREDESSLQPAQKGIHGREGIIWYPAECDVSIRPGWFYHPAEDGKVKTLEDLMEIYHRSVGRNSNLLLNVPPDRRGLIHENDAARLAELGDSVRRRYGRPLAQVWGRGPVLDLGIANPAPVDRVVLMEEIAAGGERVKEYVVEGLVAGAWRELSKGKVIGHKRIDRFDPVEAGRVRLRITASDGEPLIRQLAVYGRGGSRRSR